MQLITSIEFAHLWDKGVVREGDVLLFDRRECGGLDIGSAVIRAVQRRLLADLGEPETWLEESSFSHAALAGSARTRGILEMTSPVARARSAEMVAAGTRIMVRRPRHEGEDIAPEAGRRIGNAAWRDIAAVRRYPFWELFTYWLWSWGWLKLRRRRRFAEIFRSDRADVCSGSVWRWCVEAGLFRDVAPSDLRPEAWYPARLAVDGERFRTLGVFGISG